MATTTKNAWLNALNDTLVAAEARIYRENFGYAASIDLSESSRLHWRRVIPSPGAKWRLEASWIDNQGVQQSGHILNAPVDVRTEAATSLYRLLDALNERAEEETRVLAEAVELARRFAQGLPESD